MNRRTIAIAVLLTVPAVSGCQAFDEALSHFGPRPDATLLQLTRSASMDAESLSENDPELSALRKAQAEELTQETYRLCGLDAAGRPPQSCSLPAADEEEAAREAPAKSAREAADRELALVTEAPKDSRDLLVEQSIQLLSRAYTADAGATTGLTSTNAGNSTPRQPAPEAGKFGSTVSDLLDWQDAAVYGLDVARAFVPAEKVSEVDTLSGLYKQRADALRRAQDVDAPAPTEGAPRPTTYESRADAPELPHDGSSAVQFLDAVEANDDVEWTQAASQAAQEQNSEWLNWLVNQAARGRAAENE